MISKVDSEQVDRLDASFFWWLYTRDRSVYPQLLLSSAHQKWVDTNRIESVFFVIERKYLTNWSLWFAV
jgi:hypothetical protein